MMSNPSIVGAMRMVNSLDFTGRKLPPDASDLTEILCIAEKREIELSRQQWLKVFHLGSDALINLCEQIRGNEPTSKKLQRFVNLFTTE